MEQAGSMNSTTWLYRGAGLGGPERSANCRPAIAPPLVEAMTGNPQSERPVVVLTSCDRLTCEVRKALLGRVPLAFAESESALLQRVAHGAQLVVVHLNGAADSVGVAGRLVRAVPGLAAPIVALHESDGVRTDGAPPSGLFDDILFVKPERWQILLLAWVRQPALARQRVAELRLLHSVAPVLLLPVLDLLMLVSEPALSVKKWSAECGVNRTHLYRDIARTGMTPSGIVDAVRALHSVGPILVNRAIPRHSALDWSAVRTERRVLARTLGMTRSEIVNVGEPGSLEVRQLIADRLGKYFERAQLRSVRILPDAVSVLSWIDSPDDLRVSCAG
jgi:AraC-like DNA-binding protein